MFNLGGNDKEKLKENMEEIKDLVNSQEAGNSMPQQGTQPQDSGEPENNSQPVENISPDKTAQPDVSSQLDQTEASQMDSNQAQMNSMGQQEKSGLENNNQDVESGSGFRPVSEDSPKDSSKGKSQQSSELGTRESSGRRFSSDSSLEEKLNNFSSQRDQSQELDMDADDQSPTGSGETLFLEVDEFNQVQEMVDEMKYLSREMNDLMENLEGGVEEDRRIESEAQDVIDEFTQRRKNIEASIN